MAEHHLDGKCLAVIFDGTGFGTDGTVWGGEFLLCEDRSFIRVGAVKPISMISGDESVRQAWKSLLCHLVHSGIPSDDKRAAVVKAAVAGGLNTVKSSSMGRLFDAVSAALGLADYNTYQGRCAMLLENQAALAKRERKIPTELSFNEEVVETENGSVTFLILPRYGKKSWEKIKLLPLLAFMRQSYGLWNGCRKNRCGNSYSLGRMFCKPSSSGRLRGSFEGKRPCCVLESGASSRRRRACFRSGMVWYEYSKRKEIICA